MSFVFGIWRVSVFSETFSKFLRGRILDYRYFSTQKSVPRSDAQNILFYADPESWKRSADKWASDHDHRRSYESARRLFYRKFTGGCTTQEVRNIMKLLAHFIIDDFLVYIHTPNINLKTSPWWCLGTLKPPNSKSLVIEALYIAP